MKFTLLKLSVIAIYCAMRTSPVSAQYNWQLSKNKEGIKVYESSMNNSSYKSIKVECTLEGGFDALISVLTDVAHHKDWIYNNKDAYLLRKISPTEFYYYTETYLPWPMSNRDAVAHMKIMKDTLNRFFDVVEVGEPTYIPAKNGIVRIPRFSINWHVTMPAANKLGIVYILQVEPGGNIPSWLANMFVDKGPYESFKKLAEILKHKV